LRAVETPDAPAKRPGLRRNLRQYALLVGLNGLVGSVVGMERGSLPALSRAVAELEPSSALLAFVASFGVAKSVANRFAGRLCDSHGRRYILIVGWLAALPVPLLLAFSDTWHAIVCANLLLGVNQGFCWSAATNMQADIAGIRARGLAAGVSHTSGYVMVGCGAALAGYLTSAGDTSAALTWMGMLAFTGLAITVVSLKDTSCFVIASPDVASPSMGQPSERPPREREIDLLSASQAGLVNNLNDGSSWILLPALFASLGQQASEIGALVAVYPGTWGATQIFTGPLADHVNRRTLVVFGLALEAAAVFGLARLESTAGLAGSCALLGVGTAMVYPTLIAAVGDAAGERRRATWLGIYRFWRDLGYVVGAVGIGLLLQVWSVRIALDTIAFLLVVSALICGLRGSERCALVDTDVGAAEQAADVEGARRDR
jgi:MFS family permease